MDKLSLQLCILRKAETSTWCSMPPRDVAGILSMVITVCGKNHTKFSFSKRRSL